MECYSILEENLSDHGLPDSVRAATISAYCFMFLFVTVVNSSDSSRLSGFWFTHTPVNQARTIKYRLTNQHDSFLFIRHN